MLDYEGFHAGLCRTSVAQMLELVAGDQASCRNDAKAAGSICPAASSKCSPLGNEYWCISLFAGPERRVDLTSGCLTLANDIARRVYGECLAVISAERTQIGHHAL